MTLHRLAPALLACLVLAAAGCGGDDDENGGGGGGGGGGTTEQAGGPRDTFATTCGGCHVLEAAGTNGQVGPDLDQLKPDQAQVKQAIESGPSVMPANLLRGAEADAVAKYVADNAGR